MNTTTLRQQPTTPPRQTHQSPTVHFIFYDFVKIDEWIISQYLCLSPLGSPEFWVITHAQWDTIMLIDWCLDTL